MTNTTQTTAKVPFKPGFDLRWRDAPDYILGCTKDIWEDRGIHTLNHYYSDTIHVRSPASMVIGNAGVIPATMATLSEFPNRQLYGEDVIWCDAPNDALLSSHRLLCTATHEGAGMYGSPTGRNLSYRIIANCHAQANQIDDEWLVRDQSAIVEQMGQDIVDWTRELIDREGGPDTCVQPFTPAIDSQGPYTGRGNDSPWGAQYAEHLTALMQADFGTVPRNMDRAVEGHYWRHSEGHGTPFVDKTWMGLRAAFPSAEFEVMQVIGMDNDLIGPRASVLFSLSGRHDGWGTFGRPTGADVYIMGLAQAEFGPRGIRREYALIDETAIWKQILLATGAV